MTFYPNGATPTLEEKHRRMLEGNGPNESGIAREVHQERGVRTVACGRQLPKGFSRRQRTRGGGMLFMGHRPGGGTFPVYRPDAPDPENPGRKYEMACKALGGPGNALDVHPSVRHLVNDTSVPVVFVEGIKKADSILTAARRAGVEVLVVAISGVWNWLSEGEPIPDMLGIPVDGRKVYICFDSDVFSNPDVGAAARRLAGHLIIRGASVYLAHLPDQADGSKTGADDYLAGGHTYRELVALMRAYDPADLAAERFKRGARLRLMLEDLRRRFWAGEWSGMGGHSARDTFKVLVDVARERGKVREDGLRVRISRLELARMAKVSTRTLQKAIERLEGMGLVYRDNEGRKREQKGAFVLRANVSQYERGAARNGETGAGDGGGPPGGLHLRAPRLRWSSPGRKARRGLVGGTRRVRDSVPPQERPAVRRLGKVRGAVVDVLDGAGGVLPLADLYARLNPHKSPDDRKRWRPRDLRRRTLPMLEEERIVALDGDLVALAPDWLERLEEARELGGEAVAERRDLEDHRRKSRAFRRRLEVAPDHHFANVGADGHIEDLRPAAEPGEATAEEAPVSPLAAAIRDYLELRPADASQSPGWLSGTLWAYDLHPGKATPAEAFAALEELGGERYRRGLLERSRRDRGAA